MLEFLLPYYQNNFQKGLMEEEREKIAKTIYEKNPTIQQTQMRNRGRQEQVAVVIAV